MLLASLLPQKVCRTQECGREEIGESVNGDLFYRPPAAAPLSLKPDAWALSATAMVAEVGRPWQPLRTGLSWLTDGTGLYKYLIALAYLYRRSYALLYAL